MCNPDGISRHAPTRTAPPRTIASLPPGERRRLHRAIVATATIGQGHGLPYHAVVTMLDSAWMDAEDDRARIHPGWLGTLDKEG